MTKGQVAMLQNDGRVFCIAFSPDGRTLAVGCPSNHTINLWNVEERKKITVLKHDGGVCSLAFSPDGGILAVGGCDSTILLWCIGTSGIGMSTWAEIKRSALLQNYPNPSNPET